jgi:uncharacterized protein (TIGR03435 family)
MIYRVMQTMAVSGLFVTGLGSAQSTGKPLTFEVASVKSLSPDSNGRGRKGGGGPTGPDTSDPGRIHYSAIRLKDLILNAYNVKDFQILLAERFKLAIHREKRVLPEYSLIVARNGPTMKASPPEQPPRDSTAASAGGRRTESYDRYGFPSRPAKPGTWSWLINGRCRLGGTQATMQDLVNELMGSHLRELVTDDTGLKGKFDFILTYSRPRVDMPPGEMPDWVANPPDLGEPIPDLFGAIQSQLGLKLTAKKAPAEVIVIDRIEKRPTAN